MLDLPVVLRNNATLTSEDPMKHDPNLSAAAAASGFFLAWAWLKYALVAAALVCAGGGIVIWRFS